MATTEEFYNGGNTSYPISIEYIKATDIKVEIDGTPLTYNANPTSGQYKVVGTTVTLGAAASAGNGNVHIWRHTDLDSPAAVFAAGSSIRAQDLNACHDLVRFASQEQHQTLKTVDIQDASITTVKIKDGTIVGDDISDSAAIPFAKLATGNLPASITINSDNIINGSIKADDIEAGALDGRYYTEAESDQRYFQSDSSETISSGNTWSNADTHIATTAAINARIIDLIEEVGGFVPIVNETSFPDANPDINNGNGTIVSVQAASVDLVPSSGIVTIADGRGAGKPVYITGVTATIPKDFGFLLETTSTTHTYAFHRLTAIATEVHTIATNLSTIQAVNNNKANIDRVVANESTIEKVANNETNINLVSGELAPLATDLGYITNSISSGTPGNDINTVATNIADVKDVATSIEDGSFFTVDSANKITGSVVYYDGNKFKADTTTTKSSLVTGGNF